MSHIEKKSTRKLKNNLIKPTIDNNVSTWQIRIEAFHKSSYKIYTCQVVTVETSMSNIK